MGWSRASAKTSEKLFKMSFRCLYLWKSQFKLIKKLFSVSLHFWAIRRPEMSARRTTKPCTSSSARSLQAKACTTCRSGRGGGRSERRLERSHRGHSRAPSLCWQRSPPTWWLPQWPTLSSCCQTRTCSEMTCLDGLLRLGVSRLRPRARQGASARLSRRSRSTWLRLAISPTRR